MKHMSVFLDLFILLDTVLDHRCGAASTSRRRSQHPVSRADHGPLPGRGRRAAARFPSCRRLPILRRQTDGRGPTQSRSGSGTTTRWSEELGDRMRAFDPRGEDRALLATLRRTLRSGFPTTRGSCAGRPPRRAGGAWRPAWRSCSDQIGPQKTLHRDRAGRLPSRLRSLQALGEEGHRGGHLGPARRRGTKRRRISSWSSTMDTNSLVEDGLAPRWPSATSSSSTCIRDDVPTSPRDGVRIAFSSPAGATSSTRRTRYSGPHDISRHFSDTPQGFHLKEWNYREMFATLKAAGFSQVRITFRQPPRAPDAAWFNGLHPRRSKRVIGAAPPRP